MINTEEQINKNLLAWATYKIQRSADFSFMGSPRAFMDIESGDALKRITYYSYGYGINGPDPAPAVHKLVDDIILALDVLGISPLCIVWRRHFDIRHDPHQDRSYVTVRLAVVDQNLDQIMLRLLPIEDGDLIPDMPNE